MTVQYWLMDTKHLLYIGAAVGGLVGGWLGGLLDHGNFLGLWGILLSGAGGLAGIYLTYKLTDQ